MAIGQSAARLFRRARTRRQLRHGPPPKMSWEWWHAAGGALAGRVTEVGSTASTVVLLTDAGLSGVYAVLWATAAQTITYVCFFEIIRRAGGLFFAIINYVVVAAGLIWANILFGDQLSLWVWLAVVVLATSLALTNMGTARALRERTASAKN